MKKRMEKQGKIANYVKNANRSVRDCPIFMVYNRVTEAQREYGMKN